MDAEKGEDKEISLPRKRTRRTCLEWFKHYFWQGQELRESEAEAKRLLGESGEEVHWAKRFVVRYRRPIGFAIPAAFFHFFWWSAMIKYNAWHLFADKYFMSLTMVIGSMIAGMTSEGGGAVAFPVMTLAFRISPVTARDFSVLIQSCGMSAASFTILFMKIQCEWRALALSSAGGVLGLIIGLDYFDRMFDSVTKKMGFVSIWFAFSSVLLFLIIMRKGRVYNRIQRLNFLKALIVATAGFIGGVFTALVGNGLDICTFSVLTLLFRVSEKVATPTSVILMATNSAVAVVWRGVMANDISLETFEFLAVCLPVVVLGAPLGSVLGSHFHRNVLAMLVIVLDTVALVTAFIVIPQTTSIILMSGALVVGGIGLFSIIAYVGRTIHAHDDKNGDDNGEVRGDAETTNNNADDKSKELGDD